MPITTAWTVPSTLDLGVGSVLPESYWDNLVSNTLYLWDITKNYGAGSGAGQNVLSLLVGAADTNLYRGGVDQLKTDDDFFAVGDLLANQGAIDQIWLTTISGGAGIYFSNALDTNLFRASAGLLATNAQFQAIGAAAGTPALTTRVLADTSYRWMVQADGGLNWGPGGVAAVDTNLYRPSANKLKTDDDFEVAGAFTAPNVGVRIGEVVLAAAAAGIAFAGIPATYRHLQLVIWARSTGAVQQTDMRMYFNSDITSRYTSQFFYSYGLNTQAGDGPATTTTGYVCQVPGTTGLADVRADAVVTILNYRVTTLGKSTVGHFHGGAPSGVQRSVGLGGFWYDGTAAINRIDLTLTTGNFEVGTVVSLYGLP